MRYAITLPNMDYDAPGRADLAVESGREAGWDGVCLCGIVSNVSHFGAYDPWMILAAIAARTKAYAYKGHDNAAFEGQRPWKVARETVTLDHLSHGRFILLPVGLGETNDGGFLVSGKSWTHCTQESGRK